MCGIAGFNGKMTKKPDFNVIKILGILNEERGKDSAGIVINNTIVKEGNKTTFRELTEANQFAVDKLRGNVMLHTRAATVGALTQENAHPYYYKEEGKDGMFFMHNGTVTNIDKLVEKYKVNVEGYLTDSRKLGALIYAKHFEVFDEYLGAASICFYFESAPNTIYLFNGAGYDANKKQWIPERDLYYVSLGDGRMYFSSQENHLKNALNFPKNITQCTPNHLMKFVDGVLASSTKFERKERYATSTNKTVDYIEQPKTTYFSKNYNAYDVYEGYYGNYNNAGGVRKYSDPVLWILNGGAPKTLSLKKFSDMLFFIEFCAKELFTKEVAADHIYFDLFQYVNSNTKKPASGLFFLNELGQIIDAEKESTSKKGISCYYFYEGIMLDSGRVYYKLTDPKENWSDSDKKRYAKANAHPDTLYLGGMNGAFDSRYNKYEIENMKINEAISLPFSPFIVLIVDSVAKGFVINRSYKSFFDNDEMLNIIRTKARNNINFMTSIGYGTFQEFSQKMYDSKCVKGTEAFLTFSECYEEEKQYVIRNKVVSLNNTQETSKVKEITMEEWVDIEGTDVLIDAIESPAENSPITIQEDTDDDTDDDIDDDIRGAFIDAITVMEAEIQSVAETLDHLELKYPSSAHLDHIKEILLDLDSAISFARVNLESDDFDLKAESKQEEVDYKETDA